MRWEAASYYWRRSVEMTTMAELCELAEPSAPGGSETECTLAIPDVQDVEMDVTEIVRYFGEDPSRQAVELVIAGQPAGYIARSALYAVLPNTLKGFDDSAGAQLPGTPRPGAYRLYRFACEVPGCLRRAITPRVDRDDLPRCPDHGSAMKRVA
jgi:hypothetical protein